MKQLIKLGLTILIIIGFILLYSLVAMFGLVISIVLDINQAVSGIVLFGRGSLSLFTLIVAYTLAHGIYSDHFVYSKKKRNEIL